MNQIESEDIWDFLITQVFKKYDIGTGSGKSHVSREIAPLLGLIQDKIVQDHYVDKVARMLSVTSDAVYFEVNKNRNEVKKITTIPEQLDVKQEKERLDLLEEKLFVTLITKNTEELSKDEIQKLFSNKLIIKILSHLSKFIAENKKFDISAFSNHIPSELVNYFSEVLLNNSEEEDVDKLKKELILLKTKKEMQRIGEEIKIAENTSDLGSVEKLQQNYTDLAKQLSALE